jgi:Uma2 family endonuclease
VTAEELFSMPPSAHFERIRGGMKEKMPTGHAHGTLTFALTRGWFVQENRLGDCFAAETGFLVARDPDTVLAPDFAFIRAQNLPKSIRRRYVRAIPDLVVEIRSPSDRRKRVQDTVEEWLNACSARTIPSTVWRSFRSLRHENYGSYSKT